MAKHTGYCPNCNVTKTVEVDPKNVPARCGSCGEVLIIKTEKLAEGEHDKTYEKVAPQTPMPGPAPFPHPHHFPQMPPQFMPAPYPMPRPKEKNAGIVRSMLVSSGVLGWLFWISFFLVGYGYGTFTLDTSDPGSSTFFMFSMIMLGSSVIAFVSAFKGSFRYIVMGSVFGLISFGFLIGSILSFVALYLAVSNRAEYEE